MPERSGAGQKPSPCYDVHPGLLRSCRQNRHNSTSDVDERDSVESVDSPGDSRPRREPFYSTALRPNLVSADALEDDATAIDREVTEL
jgi:hypothetical protein